MKELGATAQSYWGEPVFTAVPVSIARVKPTLPAMGVAGSVDICEVLDGQIRDQLRDPASMLKPQEEWPDEVPKATTMMADPQEWDELANLMWERDLCLWMARERIFT